ncbi:hypothetical protein M9H77_02637 [Catharanthus roseus]|uniref:Uncharacterized protein n=1 Tax=Catharanthus roseus TaxID=4058 RepID=A0ACC0C8Y6_CATRO|nr:hypothetical protein M9H77_02637 [Catharanthus roseus]
MQEHQGVVTRAKARQLKSHKDQIEQEKLIMQELQSLRDEMRDIRRDVTNLSNQQREVSPHGSLNVTTPRSNGPLNWSRITEFHQPPHFDEELHPPPYGGRRGGFGGRGMPRHFEEVPRPQARHGEPLYDDHEHIESQRKRSGMMRSSFPNQRQVATTKPPTSNFKPWPKKEEAPRGTFQPPTKPKMEERGKIISNPPKWSVMHPALVYVVYLCKMESP